MIVRLVADIQNRLFWHVALVGASGAIAAVLGLLRPLPEFASGIVSLVT